MLYFRNKSLQLGLSVYVDYPCRLSPSLARIIGSLLQVLFVSLGIGLKTQKNKTIFESQIFFKHKQIRDEFNASLSHAFENLISVGFVLRSTCSIVLVIIINYGSGQRVAGWRCLATHPSTCWLLLSSATNYLSIHLSSLHFE